MEIGRDVTGQVIAGDHNIVISAAHGSSVTLLKPGDLPRPVRRDRIRLLPRRGLAPIGRDTELGRLLDAARPGAQVQVYGPPGVGKTTLIRQLAIRLPGDVVFLSCGGRDADDLRQDIFESCFESAGYRPSTVEMRRLMTGLEVTLVIDDLTVSDELLDAVPDACVIWTATDRQQDDVHALELRGLDQAAGIGMIERHLGRSLSRAETDSAAMIWKLTAGLPLPILQAMSAANAGGALPATRDDVVRTLIPMLDPSAREALALMLAVAPAAVTPELLSVTLPDSGADQLVRFGLVTLDEDGYRAAALDAAPLSVSRERVASVSSNILAWLAAAPTTAQQVSANGPAISRVIDLAMAAGDPSLACELARAAAPALGASLRWGSWQMIPARGTAAATKIRNSAALAYFTHENGIRSLGLGKRVAAGAALGGAIALWQQLGESSSLSAAQTAQGLAAPPGGPVAGPAWTPPPTTPSVPTSPGPAPTPAPGPGASPGPTGTPGPATPGPTPSPGPTPTPGSPPGPGAAPGPTGTPGPATPGPTPTPTPSPPPGPTPVPPPGSEGLVFTAVTKGGMSLMAKIAISGAAVAVGGLGALGITSAVNSDSGGTGVVYYVIRSKHLPQGFKPAPNTACETRIPGTFGESVSVSVCTVELEHTSDMDSTYRLIEGSLNGGQILHWGCKEPAPSLECHIDVDDQPKTVCVSTTLDDDAVQAACEKDAGPKAPEAPPVVAH